jgi:MYXO-CTERM domain-containing protein
LRLNRLTGEQELIPLTNHMLFLTLPGGTGDLFKYNTSDFVGITLVPEPSIGAIGLLTAGGAAMRRRRNIG